MESVISFTRGSQLRALTVGDYGSYTIQPFIQDILNHFLESDDLATSIAQAAETHSNVAEAFFEIDTNNIVESFSLKTPLLFPDRNPVLSFSFSNALLAPFLPIQKPEIIRKPETLLEIHQLLHLCGQAKYSYHQICQQVSDAMVNLLDRFMKASVVQEQPRPAQPILIDTPGAIRLQHAALLYRTKTTGILVDPQLHSTYGLSRIQQDITRAVLEGYVDGILISHSHYDHWNYPTLMMFPPDLPIIVPKVPRGSITCEDMQAQLKNLGFQNVIAVDWYADPITIGDIEIHVLPFYGEQPLVPEYNTPKHPDLRNWGNTYLLQTPYYSSWFLVDAGTDPMGSMTEVAEYVRKTFGTVDQVLSNFQPLSYNSIGTDLSSWGVDIIGNLLSNPQIFSVTNKTEGFHLATLGPKGVAEICQIVDAQVCMPYAHSWAEPGEYTLHDQSLIQAVIDELSQLGCSTEVVPWRIGDGYVTQGQTAQCDRIFY